MFLWQLMSLSLGINDIFQLAVNYSLPGITWISDDYNVIMRAELFQSGGITFFLPHELCMLERGFLFV